MVEPIPSSTELLHSLLSQSFMEESQSQTIPEEINKKTHFQKKKCKKVPLTQYLSQANDSSFEKLGKQLGPESAFQTVRPTVQSSESPHIDNPKKVIYGKEKPTKKSQQFSFRPQVDIISHYLIEKKRWLAPFHQPRWEELFALDRAKRERRDRLYLEKKMQEEELSVRECTFKPRLSRRTLSEMNQQRNIGSLYDRSMEWKSIINDRLDQAREQAELEEERTLLPLNISNDFQRSPVPLFRGPSVESVHGTTKFLRRQKKALEEKAYIQNCLKEDIADNWTLRRITIPVAFSLSSNRISKTANNNTTIKKSKYSSKHSVMNFEKEKQRLHENIKNSF